MNPVAELNALIARVRHRIWLTRLVRLLGQCLWGTALILLVGALLRWRIGAPNLVGLALAAALPLMVGLGLALTRRPTGAQAADLADRRLGAGALLTTAWHLTQPGTSPAGGAAVVLAQAARALPGWSADPRLLPRATLPWSGLLSCLAALPLLALDGAGPVQTSALSAGLQGLGPGVQPEGMVAAGQQQTPASPLSMAIAALAPVGTPRLDTDRPGQGDRTRGGHAPSQAGPSQARTSKFEPKTELGQGEDPPSNPGLVPAVAVSPEGASAPTGDVQAPMPAAHPGSGGRDGAGGGTIPRGPDQAIGPRMLDQDPERTQRLVEVTRTGTPNGHGTDQGDALTGPAPGASTAPKAMPPQARMPTSGADADPIYSPAQRALIARYLAPRTEASAP